MDLRAAHHHDKHSAQLCLFYMFIILARMAIRDTLDVRQMPMPVWQDGEWYYDPDIKPLPLPEDRSPMLDALLCAARLALKRAEGTYRHAYELMHIAACLRAPETALAISHQCGRPCARLDSS